MFYCICLSLQWTPRPLPIVSPPPLFPPQSSSCIQCVVYHISATPNAISVPRPQNNPITSAYRLRPYVATMFKNIRRLGDIFQLTYNQITLAATHSSPNIRMRGRRDSLQCDCTTIPKQAVSLVAGLLGS